MITRFFDLLQTMIFYPQFCGRKMRLVAAALLGLTALCVSLSACATSQPQSLTLSSMPVYPGARETTDPTDRQNLDLFTGNFTSSAGVLQHLENKMYLVGQNTTWDQVSQFYSTELEKVGWNLKGSRDTSNEHAKVWQRTNQYFVIGTVSDSTVSEMRIAVLLATQ